MENINLTKEEAELEIENMEMSVRTSNCLKRAGVKTIGGLLELNYEDLSQVKNLGKKGLEEILEATHKMGYKITGEKPSWEEERKRLRKENQILLEDYGIPFTTILYKNGIFTREQMIENLGKIEDMKGLGPEKKNILRKTLIQKGIVSEVTPKEKESIDNLAKQRARNIQLEEENSKIRERIQEKHDLLEKYQQLIEENQKLIEEEQKLDEELKKIRGEVDATKGQHTRKNQG